jgi:hypothetical protein
LNIKQKSLKLDNVEDEWNNFRKIVCKVTDGLLGKKVRNPARNISKNALCLIKRRRGLDKNYLRDKSYENKKNVKKVEKALKYQLEL